jgi:hypothetical protein
MVVNCTGHILGMEEELESCYRGSVGVMDIVWVNHSNVSCFRQMKLCFIHGKVVLIPLVVKMYVIMNDILLFLMVVLMLNYALKFIYDLNGNDLHNLLLKRVTLQFITHSVWLAE